MIAFLEKLTKRKTEVALKGATAWQQLVADVLDEKEGDPDAVLIELDRLGRTPEDLTKAVELLGHRRTWAKQLEDGDAAEADLTATTGQLEKMETELEKMIERHEAKTAPVVDKRLGAIQRIQAADSARRRLIETASDPVLVQAVRDADAGMSALRKNQSAFAQLERGRDQLQISLSAHDDPELKPQLDGLEHRRTQATTARDGFREQAHKLNAASESARRELLRPEAI